MAKVFVAKSFLPPRDEFDKYVDRIWENGQLTNQGPLVLEFQNKIEEYLGIDNFHFLNNGTLALQIALRALEVEEGEIITTPFSYVATTSSIMWEKYTPVFVDIEPDTYCIDPDKIEAAITENTRAIMPVHVFGFPCDVEKIDAIAEKHNLKVIYDAAHAFGAQYKGKSLMNYGDASTQSFHATKLFQTIEGGGVVFKKKEDSDRAELQKRFGHNGDDHFMLGINAKANEFQAAMGLCNIKYIDELISQRKELFEKYNQLIDDSYKKPVIGKDSKHNYGYYPIVLSDEATLISVVSELKEKDIYPRRYFYPSLNKLPYIDRAQTCPISEDIASRILCLPLYPGLAEEAVEVIADTLNKHAA